MKLRFFNTFEPVIPLYRQLLPHLRAQGFEAEAVLANRRYRPGGLRAGEAPFPIREVPTLAPGGLRSRVGKLCVYATYSLSAAIVSLLSRGVDLNVFLTQPPLFSAWGQVLRLLRRQRYLMIVMDLYPWVAIQAGALRPSGLPARLAGAAAATTLRRAEGVVVIGRCMAERVAALGVERERIHLIPNWADTEVVQPIPTESNRLRRELGLDGKLVVMYSGNLGVTHYFDDLLAVAGRLKKRQEVAFLVAGGGSRLSEVQDTARDAGLSNVHLLGYQRHQDLALSLSAGDLHFVSLRSGFEGLVVPSKAYGVLAAGRPLIYQGSPQGEIARMIAEDEVGKVVAQGDVDGLEAAIVSALEDPPWRHRTGARARRLAEVRYSPAPGLAAYRAVISSLGGRADT